MTICHAVRPIPPSSNPACGFPALGFPENSRLKHSQGVARVERSQVHQSQILKVHVHRLPFRKSKGPLTPSCLAFRPSFCLSRESFSGSLTPFPNRDVGLSATCSSVVELSFKRFSFYIARNMFPVRPLGSTGITPLPSYYGPVRLPTRAAKGLFLPQRCCGWGHTLPGLPGSSANLSARAVPYHPGEPDSCIRPLLHCRHWASPILNGWPLSLSLTRPRRIRLRYGSRLRLTRLRQFGLPRPALDRLLAKRTTYKVNSFQFTRLTRLCLAHQDIQDSPL